jgi:thymidine phosphorylase
VTSTVESIDLITASILSKKLAAGLDALVLDVKTGSAAFMATHEDARALARSLVDTANGAGCRTVALLTDMHQPLAPAVGNAVEVAECMDALTGGPLDTPLVELTIDLCATLLLTCGAQTDEATARQAARDAHLRRRRRALRPHGRGTGRPRRLHRPLARPPPASPCYP